MPETQSLEHQFRTILAAMQCVSAGCIYSYSPVGTKTGYGSRIPTTGGGEEGAIAWLVERWNETGDDEGRRALVKEAEGKLEELRRGNRGEKRKAALDSAKNLHEAIIEKGKGFSTFDVALKFRCTESLVRRVRVKAELDPAKGEQKQGTVSQADPSLAALSLRAKGYSTREIASKLGTHQNQVMRWVRKAAA